MIRRRLMLPFRDAGRERHPVAFLLARLRFVILL